MKEAFQILQIVKVKKGQCVQFYAIVFENWDETDNVLGKHILPHWHKEKCE